MKFSLPIKIALFIATTGLFCLNSQADVHWAHKPRPVVHKFTGDETVWFLSKIYYGNSHKFDQILLTNGLSDPSKIKEGQWLIIHEPKYNPNKKGQKEKMLNRYVQLYQHRAAVLASKIQKPTSNRMPASVVNK
jgi:hypothetical protein